MLITIYPLIMKLLLISILLLALCNLRALASPFRKVSRIAWILLGLLFFSSLIIRVAAIPHTHQVYYDEYEHINIAENMLHSGRFCLCEIGDSTDCQSCRLMSWPPGYHTFLSLVFSSFGDSEAVAFNANAAIGSLSVVAAFLLIFLLSEEASIAMLGAAMISLVPVHLKYSGTAALGVFSAFCILLSMTLLEIHLRDRRTGILALFLAVTVYTVQVRPENILLLIIFPVYILSGRKFSEKERIGAMISLVLLIPFFRLLIYGAGAARGWGDSLLMRAGHLAAHMVPNSLFFIDYRFNSLLLAPLCILGFMHLYRKDRRILAYMAGIFLLFFITYTSFRTGLLLTSADTVRYSLALYVPLSVLAAFGFSFIRNNWLKAAALAVFILSLIPTAAFISSPSSFAPQHRLIVSMADDIPDDAYVISYNPAAIIATIHKKSISPDDFLRYRDQIRLDEVMLFKDYWWQQDGAMADVEQELRQDYGFETIRESGGYGFYRLTE